MNHHNDLMIRRCGACAQLLAPLTVECSFCQGFDLEWVPTSGAGTIVSWRITDKPSLERRGELERTVIAIVELDAGPWLYSTVEGEIDEHRNQPVRVQFKPQPPGGRFPVFEVCPRRTVKQSVLTY